MPVSSGATCRSDVVPIARGRGNKEMIGPVPICLPAISSAALQLPPDCHFADIPFPSLLIHLLKAEGVETVATAQRREDPC